MTKHKSPSELKSKVIRVNIGDWQWLNSLAQQLDITVAEAFHKVITETLTDQDHKAPRQPAQIPMRITTPVALRTRLQPTIATNGNKHVAFRIKTKGVRYD